MSRTVNIIVAMTYSIFDNGNLVASFDAAEAAQDAFNRIAAEESQPADTLLLVAFDENGYAVASCAPGEPLFTAA